MKTSSPSLLAAIKNEAFEIGFDHTALAPLTIPEQDKAAYASWCADGGAAGMSYMTRDPEKRLDPSLAFPGAKSVLTLGVSYFQGPFPEKPGPAFGRVARYAWGFDYHTIIFQRLDHLLGRINHLFGGRGKALLAVDTKPLLERALAQASGMGFIGKNTVLIMPRKTKTGFHIGSWIFLAEILLDIPFEELDDTPVATSTETLAGCGGCTKCLTACPTDALERPYYLKAERCISYLTIENKGDIPMEMRPRLGDWIFGCDICQEVCPFNARAIESRWPEFKPEHGTGPWLSLKELLSCPDQASFQKKWSHTPLSRAKRKGLLRNACVVAGNSGDRTLVPFLEPLLVDPEPMINIHARWAFEALS